MPWAGLRQEVNVGPVRFWPWDERKVPDTDVRQQLKRYFKCFVDHYGTPVKTITICSHREKNFELLEQYEYDEIRVAIDVLIFSIIAPQTRLAVCGNTYSAGPPTTDRYQVIGQHLILGNPNIHIKAGSTLSVDEIEKVHISQPWSLGGAFRIGPNQEIIRAFDKVFKQSFPSIIRKRIFRSLEWFRFAHTEADQVSEPSKLVMMSTAFEILLDFSKKREKKKYFVNQIEKRLKRDESVLDKRIYNNNQRIYIKAACWAWDFYNLRSRIVHGDEISTQDLCYKNWITHNIVADMVIWELIVQELYENNCIGERARKWAETFKPHVINDENLEEFFLNWTMGFDDYHRALDWIEPQMSRYQSDEIL
ncbi:MAG: hypothetical protein JW715_00935 [Sedimentisphaerales bacterium]|nr:hypothetical protein [Sedimentisphaerales bacterium]